MKILLMVLSFAISFAHAADRPIIRTMNDKDIIWGPCPELFPAGCQIGMLQGDSKKKNADVFLKIPSNYKIPSHTHTSAEHMTMISGNLEIKYKGEEKTVLNPGSFAFGPPKHAHEAMCISKDSCVLFISFDEPIDAHVFKGTI